MHATARALRGVGDRLLAALVPHSAASADRYRCYWDYYCVNGWVYRMYCCIDDYTGQVAWCDPVVVDMNWRC